MSNFTDDNAMHALGCINKIVNDLTDNINDLDQIYELEDQVEFLRKTVESAHKAYYVVIYNFDNERRYHMVLLGKVSHKQASETAFNYDNEMGNITDCEIREVSEDIYMAYRRYMYLHDAYTSLVNLSRIDGSSFATPAIVEEDLRLSIILNIGPNDTVGF